jgi:hypothetical protein
MNTKNKKTFIRTHMNKQFIIIATLFTAVTFTNISLAMKETTQKRRAPGGRMRHIYPDHNLINNQYDFQRLFNQVIVSNASLMVEEGKTKEHVSNYMLSMQYRREMLKQEIIDRNGPSVKIVSNV